MERYQQIFDRDREEMQRSWHDAGSHQTLNCDALATSPEFDRLIRHPKVVEPLSEVMGGELCFSEICIRHMAPYDGEPSQAWHRDRPHWMEHPYRADYMQLMLYLTAVDQATHCFSISPEASDQEVLELEAQLERGGVQHLYGPAGTGILFNVSVLHTATVRPTASIRKSVQVYYGHRHRPYLSEDSLIPTRLWRDHKDAEVRGFYSVLNGKTQKYLDRTAGRAALSRQEMA